MAALSHWAVACLLACDAILDLGSARSARGRAPPPSRCPVYRTPRATPPPRTTAAATSTCACSARWSARSWLAASAMDSGYYFKIVQSDLIW